MKKYLPLLGVLLLGTLLRFYHNTDISLWHDEAFSALLIRYDWGEMLYRIGLDVHPPAYYVLLRLWSYGLGSSLLALRGFSVLFGVGTIWATWLLARAVFKHSALALWAALLVAVNPFQVQYVTEARMYTMGAFFAVTGAYLLVTAQRDERSYHQDERLNMPNLPADLTLRRSYLVRYLGFALCLAVMALTHYYLLFSAAALAIYGLWHHVVHYRGAVRRYLPFLVACAIALAAFVPWLPAFLYQLRQVGEGYWIPKMDVWSIPSTLWQLFVGIRVDVGNPSTQKLLVAFSAVVALVFYRFLRRTEAWEKRLIAVSFLAPFLGSLAFALLARLKGSESSVYLVRYFLFVTAFGTVALVGSVASLRRRHVARVLFCVYAALNLYAFWHYWDELNVKARPGMAAAARYLRVNVEPHHKIYLGTSFMFFNFKYYNKTPVVPLLFTGGITRAQDISHFAGSAILADSDLLPDFNKDVKSGDTVWLIWTHAFGSSRPKVPSGWTELGDQDFPDVRPYLGTSVHVTQYQVN